MKEQLTNLIPVVAEITNAASDLIKREQNELDYFNTLPLISRVKGKYQLNLRWVETLGIDEVQDRAQRNLARKLLCQLGRSVVSLSEESGAVHNIYNDLTFKARVSLEQLKDLEPILKSLETWVGCIKERSKSIRYDVRELTELLKKALNTAPVKSPQVTGAEGNTEMAKTAKKVVVSVSTLLARLAEAADQDEKREIRKQLRAAGHKGGLNGTGKKVAKKIQPKSRKAAKVVDNDDDGADLEANGLEQ